MIVKIDLMAAPPALSPGGYVSRAYADKVQPSTPSVQLEASRQGSGWHLLLDWPCPEPVKSLGGDADRFVDAAAILAPSGPNTQWMTMGSPNDAVSGFLWRANKKELTGIHAEGLGTVERSPAQDGWKASAEWNDGRWQLEVEISQWKLLDKQQRIAIAIWRGADQDRGGLKSVSTSWIQLNR